MCQAVYEKVVCGYIQDVCNLHKGFQTWFALSKFDVADVLISNLTSEGKFFLRQIAFVSKIGDALSKRSIEMHGLKNWKVHFRMTDTRSCARNFLHICVTQPL